MSIKDFKSELEALGYNVQEPKPHSVAFEYTVPLGKNKGIKVMMGFEGLKSYPMNCPHGPHFKSKGMNNWTEPQPNIHDSKFGSEWRHWSRPFKEWNNGEKTVKRYLAHIRNVLNKL